MAVDAIIQARMSSTRLPGKVLKKLNGITSLECLLNQISFSKLLNHKIIATTTEKEDDPIYELANSKNFEIFRGNKFDVLDRYYQCAKKYKMNSIVRITADDPLIDPLLVDKVIEIFENGEFDYVSNCQYRSFPYGTEVEIFSFKALEKAWTHAKTPIEREHVTTYIINNPNFFSSYCLRSEKNLSNLRWTVDKKEDYEFVKAIYAKLKKHPILLEDILNEIKNNPEILEINKNVALEYGNQL